MNKKNYSIYKYLPTYICRIISTIKKTNIGGIQIPKKTSPCDHARPTGLLPTEPDQLLAMTGCGPHPVLHAEVIRIHTIVAILRGLAPSGKCLQLYSQLP